MRIPLIIEYAFDAFKDDVRIGVHATSRSGAADVWSLLAQPAAWPEWAPHISGVEVDGRPAAPGAMLIPGQDLRISSLGLIGVPAVVTRVEPQRRWDFAVRPRGAWTLLGVHEIRAVAGGSEVRVSLRVSGPGAPAALPGLLAYRPFARLAVRRLARLASNPA